MKNYDAADYKRYGFISQKQPGVFAMRLRNIAGNTTVDKMLKVAELAAKYGRGQIHFTTRQAIEIPWVKEEDFPRIMNDVLEAGLLPAVCGPRVRTIVTCPGNEVCKFGLVDTVKMAEILDPIFVGRQLPAKTKFAVNGCSNSCVKPQENDIGVKGVVKTAISKAACVACGACIKKCPAKALSLHGREVSINHEKCLGCGWCIKACPRKAVIARERGCRIYVGGKIGRFPQLGQALVDMVSEKDVPAYLEEILATYQELANPGERIAQVINRIGFDKFKETFEFRICKHQSA